MHFTAPSRGFVTLYTVAIAGMFVSFMPFIMVLLPLKVAAVAGPDRVTLLSAAALGGAVVASIANIVFGLLSDRSYRRRGTRRPWIAAGLVALVIAYAAFHFSHTPTAVLLAVAGLQVAINLGFSPILAMMADEVPDAQKGLVAGLMSTGQPIGSLVAVLLFAVPGLEDGGRYILLCAIFVAMIAPLVLLVREREARFNDAPPSAPATLRRWDFARAWTARMLVQISGNGLNTYCFYYFLRIIGETGDKSSVPAGPIVTVMAVATVIALFAAVIGGWASDRTMRRKPFLAVSSVAMAAGLFVMAGAQTMAPAAIGYLVAMAAMSVFLGVHAALAMQLLPSPHHRGRDLGLLNLTNTFPGMIAPLIAFYLAPQASGFGPLLIVLAVSTLLGGAMTLSVATER